MSIQAFLDRYKHKKNTNWIQRNEHKRQTETSQSQKHKQIIKAVKIAQNNLRISYIMFAWGDIDNLNAYSNVHSFYPLTNI